MLGKTGAGPDCTLARWRTHPLVRYKFHIVALPMFVSVLALAFVSRRFFASSLSSHALPSQTLVVVAREYKCPSWPRRAQDFGYMIYARDGVGELGQAEGTINWPGSILRWDGVSCARKASPSLIPCSSFTYSQGVCRVSRHTYVPSISVALGRKR